MKLNLRRLALLCRLVQQRPPMWPHAFMSDRERLAWDDWIERAKLINYDVDDFLSQRRPLIMVVP